MMLVLSTCSQRLSEEEFVAPIRNILDKLGMQSEVRRYDESFDPAQYEKIIICGTAIKDFSYMSDEGKFSWIRDYQGKLLGICSGAQMIAVAFGCGLERSVMIGKKSVSITKRNRIAVGEFESYFLITQKPILNEQFIQLDNDGYIFRHKRRYVYGLMFHPEVLNRSIVEDFSRK